jgi:poly-beta-1,6-N-acetyl-D-glucosamine synthase
MFFAVVTLLLGFAYLGLLAWYHYGWRLAGNQNEEREATFLPVGVSVIVPARNEEGNIEACLDSLMSQYYDKKLYEIIVVDDASDDLTAFLVERQMQKWEGLRLLRLTVDSSTTSHKKRAIEAGIAASTGKLIVCTDADCTHSPEWLNRLVHAYQGGVKKFIAAPVVYHTKPDLLSVFQTLDFMTLQGITAASVATGFHTMCNGANIAYEKAAFEEVKGFDGIDSLPTGDDMLLMYKIYKRYPEGITYVLDKDAIVSTEAAKGWVGFFQQRIRWASKAAFYEDRRIFKVLLLVYMVNVWLVVLAISALWWPQSFPWLLGLLIVKTIAEGLFLWPVASFMGKKIWMLWFPFLQPLHIVYTLIAGWLGRFGSYHWKGRTIAKPRTLLSN